MTTKQLQRKVTSLEKKVQTASEQLSRAVGRRKNKGQRLQSPGEMNRRSRLSDLRSELYRVQSELAGQR